MSETIINSDRIPDAEDIAIYCGDLVAFVNSNIRRLNVLDPPCVDEQHVIVKVPAGAFIPSRIPPTFNEHFNVWWEATIDTVATNCNTGEVSAMFLVRSCPEPENRR